VLRNLLKNLALRPIFRPICAIELCFYENITIPHLLSAKDLLI